MKRILGITLACLLILSMVSLVSSAEDYIPIKKERWNNLEDWQRFVMEIEDPDVNEEIFIAGYYFTRPIVRDFYGGYLVDRVQAYVDAVESVWPGRTVLALAVSPWGFDPQPPSFLPDNFKFSQGLNHFDVDTKTDIRGEEKFYGGELVAVTAGFVVVPEGIDLYRDFSFWYGNEYVRIAGIKKD
ncbi:hypothetical protein KGY64_04495 [Candidatus Bipolaricaulota bacterium]|nr:hypothetical protein [Candidatus Bipolaricaulota bacterium]